MKPSKATANEQKKMKLSAIDEVAPPAYEPIIFYYNNNNNNNNDKMIPSSYSMSTSLERLEKSLSETLSCFYPLAGRFNI
ncbi:MAG: acyltransferase, partial [Serratia symbiotica]|nr:acyltransferase [Serratia symbiotica]